MVAKQKIENSLPQTTIEQTENHEDRLKLPKFILPLFILIVLVLILELFLYFEKKGDSNQMVAKKTLSLTITPKPAVNNLSNKILEKEDETNKNPVNLTDINMDVNIWIRYETQTNVSAKITKTISFIYPLELFIYDWWADSGTIWLRTTPPTYTKLTPVSIEITSTHLKLGAMPNDPSCVTTKYNINNFEVTRVAWEDGASYYLNYDGTNSQPNANLMNFEILFGDRNLTKEEKRIGERIIEEVINSFNFSSK